MKSDCVRKGTEGAPKRALFHALGIYRGNSAVAPQPHTQHLGKAVHGVRCIHTGA